MDPAEPLRSAWRQSWVVTQPALAASPFQVPKGGGQTERAPNMPPLALGTCACFAQTEKTARHTGMRR